MSKVTCSTIEDLANGSFDAVSKRNGVFTVRRGFFYTNGKTAKNLEATVLRIFPDAKVVDSGEHWAAFKGGASVAKQSHWYVNFTL